MSAKKPSAARKAIRPVLVGYDHLLGSMDRTLTTARSFAARAVHTVMTDTYWDAGRQIIEFEKGGQDSRRLRCRFANAAVYRSHCRARARLQRG